MGTIMVTIFVISAIGWHLKMADYNMADQRWPPKIALNKLEPWVWLVKIKEVTKVVRAKVVCPISASSSNSGLHS